MRPINDTDKYVLNRVRQIISESGRTQLSIARAANIAPPNLSAYLNGHRRFMPKTLDRLLEVILPIEDE